jgi:hypothetical protein
MRTSANKICGGYHSIGWDKSSEVLYSRDQKAFLFSVDHKKVFKPKEGVKAMFFRSGIAFSFGRFSLGLWDSP